MWPGTLGCGGKGPHATSVTPGSGAWMCQVRYQWMILESKIIWRDQSLEDFEYVECVLEDFKFEDFLHEDFEEKRE